MSSNALKCAYPVALQDLRTRALGLLRMQRPDLRRERDRDAYLLEVGLPLVQSDSARVNPFEGEEGEDVRRTTLYVDESLVVQLDAALEAHRRADPMKRECSAITFRAIVLAAGAVAVLKE